MPFHFRRSIKTIPGVRLNFSKKGVGTSVGVKGFHISNGPSGSRMTSSIPGTGISFSTKLGGPKRSNPKGSGGCLTVFYWITIGWIIFIFKWMFIGIFRLFKYCWKEVKALFEKNSPSTDPWTQNSSLQGNTGVEPLSGNLVSQTALDTQATPSDGIIPPIPPIPPSIPQGSISTQPKRSKWKAYMILAFAGLLMICCVISLIQTSTPEYKATATAEAILAATQTYQAIPTNTCTSTPTKTLIPTMTLTSTILPTNTAVFKPSPQPTQTGGVCNCKENYDCSDFKTQKAAQACFNYCGGSASYNFARLDGTDNDGKACESLP